MINLGWDYLPDETQNDILSHLCAHCNIAKHELGELTCPFGLDPYNQKCPYGDDFLSDIDGKLDEMSQSLERYVNEWI